jgi:hypothetical protein
MSISSRKLGSAFVEHNSQIRLDRGDQQVWKQLSVQPDCQAASLYASEPCCFTILL